MVANLSFIFTNSDPLLDFPRPTLHKIVDIGGLGVRKPKELDKVLLKEDRIRKGFIGMGGHSLKKEDQYSNLFWKCGPVDANARGVKKKHSQCY